MISLCLNLCKQVGFRPAATALAIVFDWLGIDAKVPSWDGHRPVKRFAARICVC